MAAALRRSHSWMTGDMSSSQAIMSRVESVGCHCIEEQRRNRLHPTLRCSYYTAALQH